MIASKYLNTGQVYELEQCIASVEQDTSAEIVCAVATESGRYDRAEAVVGMLGALVALLVLNLYASATSDLVVGAADGERGGAAIGWTQAETLEFTTQVLVLTLGFVAGNVLASWWVPLRRLVTRRGQMEAEVARAAAFLFAEQRMASTRGAGGLLLFVSLYERKLVVLGDSGVVAACGEEFLDSLRDQGIATLRSGKPDEALIEAVRSAGELLVEKMPPRDEVADEDNELSNHVRLIHPRP